MALTEIVLGIASLGSATIGSALYGFADAKGTPLPAREFVWPGTLLASLYVGVKIPLPDNGPSKGVGVALAAGVGVVGAGCYGLGYLIGAADRLQNPFA